MSIRGLSMILLAVALVASACDRSSSDDPTTSPEATEAVAVPDGWTTHAGNGFEISTPPGWQVTDQRGEWTFNVEGDQGDLPPLVSVEAVPTAGLPPAERLDVLTATIAGGDESFEVVADEQASWPSASAGLRREVTYVGPGPAGEDLDVHEYFVVAVDDEIDVHIRAAALEEQFADAQSILLDIIDTLVVAPDTFRGGASEDPTS